VVREIVKLAVAAAIIVIAGGLIALFASGYISAFKPGGAAEAPGEHVTGGSSSISGVTSVVSTPVPSPTPQPVPVMPETVQMPFGPQPATPSITPVLPPVILPTPPAGPDARIIQDRLTPAPTAQPAIQPPQQIEKPIFTWPAMPLLPGQSGWMQVSNWLLRIAPVLFPGLFPGWTWWT
jgi:hypothetical protein